MKDRNGRRLGKRRKRKAWTKVGGKISSYSKYFRMPVDTVVTPAALRTGYS